MTDLFANTNYSAFTGTNSTNPFIVHFDTRDPNVYDVNYPVQKYWVNTTNKNLWILTGFTTTAAVVYANWINITAGTVIPVIGLGTPFGVSPVVPNVSGIINYTSTANTIKITGSTNNVNFDITGGLEAISSFIVDTVTAPGVQPVVPTTAGQVVITGAQVAAGAVGLNAIQTHSIAANQYNIEIQRSTSSTLSLPIHNGISHFDSASFLVDSNGFVQMNPNMPYYSMTPYIVGSDVHSQYTTIASAITQAVSDGASSTNPKNIYIKPKNNHYTENLTIVDGINLIGHGTQTTIIGKVSMSAAGTASINNLTLQTNSDFCLSVTGSAVSELMLTQCTVIGSNNTAIQFSSSNASASIGITYSSLNLQTTGIAAFAASSAGNLSFTYSILNNTGASTTASTCSAGTLGFFDCIVACPVTTSGTSLFNAQYSVLDNGQNTTPIIAGGSGTHGIQHCSIASGSASAVSVSTGCSLGLAQTTVSSSNTNAITGVGTLNAGIITFTGSSSTINTSTVNKLTTYGGTIV